MSGIGRFERGRRRLCRDGNEKRIELIDRDAAISYAKREPYAMVFVTVAPFVT